jgi:hypothetical protein
MLSPAIGMGELRVMAFRAEASLKIEEEETLPAQFELCLPSLPLAKRSASRLQWWQAWLSRR